MRIAHVKLRTKVLIGTLGLLVALWATSSIQVRAMEKQLNVIAQQRAAAVRSPGVDATTSVTVTRQYLLFGQPKGKIDLYSRVNSGPQAGQIESIEYYYALKNGKWTLLESGACSGPECQLRGRKAFATLDTSETNSTKTAPKP